VTDTPDLQNNRTEAVPLGFAFFNEVNILGQLSNALLAKCLPDGVHPSHFAILNHLSRMGDGKSPVRIAEAMQVTKNTMTHSLKVLEGRGFVDVRPNPEDGRGKLAYLTDAGRTFRDRAIIDVMAEFDTLFGPDHLETMTRMMADLQTLRKHMDDNRR